MREITTHIPHEVPQGTPCRKGTRIFRLGDTWAKYFVAVNAGSKDFDQIIGGVMTGTIEGARIPMQAGPRSLELNGITDEALLAIVIDRLERFQVTETACLETEGALEALHAAIELLHDRSRRLMREAGIEMGHLAPGSITEAAARRCVGCNAPLAPDQVCASPKCNEQNDVGPAESEVTNP